MSTRSTFTLWSCKVSVPSPPGWKIPAFPSPTRIAATLHPWPSQLTSSGLYVHCVQRPELHRCECTKLLAGKWCPLYCLRSPSWWHHHILLASWTASAHQVYNFVEPSVKTPGYFSWAVIVSSSSVFAGLDHSSVSVSPYTETIDFLFFHSGIPLEAAHSKVGTDN